MGTGVPSLAMRVLLFFAGLMVAAPTGGVAGMSHVALTLTALALSMLPLAFAWRNGTGPTVAAA
jgi:hypothetical protein